MMPEGKKHIWNMQMVRESMLKNSLDKRPEVIVFARQHNMPVVTIADLVAYRQAQTRQAS